MDLGVPPFPKAANLPNKWSRAIRHSAFATAGSKLQKVQPRPICITREKSGSHDYYHSLGHAQAGSVFPYLHDLKIYKTVDL